MTTKKTTATELRRCTGSARFGIELHEVPVSEYPEQPSRRDGLGDDVRRALAGVREGSAGGAGRGCGGG